MKPKWTTQLTAGLLACAVLIAPIAALGAESAKDEAKKEKKSWPSLESAKRAALDPASRR